MKVIIDIPSKEFEDDIKDNFQDFFERIKVEIAHRINTNETLLCGNYERETAKMFLEAFKNMQVISDNATNGDVLETMYDIVEKEDLVNCVGVRFANRRTGNAFKKSWYDAPYKKR